jgi:signal transduction histidine kinase/DNA-binding response OmpR family regulator
MSVCLIVLIALNADKNIKRMSDNNAELYSAFRISELMKTFRSDLLVLDNKQKGFLITGDPRYLMEYRAKEIAIRVSLKNMEQYFSGRAENVFFSKLQELSNQKLSEAKDLKQGDNLAGYQNQNGDENVSLQTMEEIRAQIDLINESLSRTTKTLIDNSVQFVSASKRSSMLQIALGILIALAALTILLRDVNVRNRLEAELRVAKQKAEDNALLKEQFMANMSHEIRTPMNAIIGFTDLLGKTTLNREQHDYLNAVRTSGSNLLNIINDILDFSKIEAGRLHFEKVSFELPAVISTLKKMFEVRAREKQISFTVRLAENVPAFLFGDPTRLSQILTNLVNNAIKFTARGGVELACELADAQQENVLIRFRVKDTGIGIAPEKLNAVFERFTQANHETTRLYGGSGLGLSIVKSLAEMQGGKVTVKSELEKGSEFIIELPFQLAYESSDSATQVAAPLPPLGNYKVLLAEDNELNQKLAVNYLESFGLEVEVANNGLTVIEKLKEKHFDLVLMDIQMPLLDGYDTAKKLRAEMGSSLPIVAMTAHILQGEKEKCLACGMNDYITKPFREAELYAMVKKHLKHGKAAGTIVKADAASQCDVSLDLADLEVMSRGNAKFLNEMIMLFLEKNPQDTSQLQAAASSGNFGQLRETAHRMKTSVGFMGLKKLLPDLDDIELNAENGNRLAEIREKVKYIETCCAEARLELKKMLQKTHTPT